LLTTIVELVTQQKRRLKNPLHVLPRRSDYQHRSQQNHLTRALRHFVSVVLVALTAISKISTKVLGIARSEEPFLFNHLQIRKAPQPPTEGADATGGSQVRCNSWKNDQRCSKEISMMGFLRF